MKIAPSLTTERLILRPWRPEDLEPFAALNADERVTITLGGSLTRAQSDTLVERIVLGFATQGFGQWAVEIPGEAPFIGFIGLSVPSFDAPFMPAVEIGWRLAFDHWGKGYATEGARAALEFGFTTAGLDEIVSFTAASNMRSRAVMERLGMHRDPRDDFSHVRLGKDHPLFQHVLFRLKRREWRH
ncbi:MAG TPA: GNAT family N-acetyltransferase [Dongiaceae bacterium]|jgi:RimJ/RimL family protein N-acetyltransferase